MNVENAPRKALHEVWRQPAHVAGEAHQIDVVSFEGIGNRALVSLARLDLAMVDRRRRAIRVRTQRFTHRPTACVTAEWEAIPVTENRAAE